MAPTATPSLPSPTPCQGWGWGGGGRGGGGRLIQGAPLKHVARGRHHKVALSPSRTPHRVELAGQAQAPRARPPPPPLYPHRSSRLSYASLPEWVRNQVHGLSFIYCLSFAFIALRNYFPVRVFSSQFTHSPIFKRWKNTRIENTPKLWTQTGNWEHYWPLAVPKDPTLGKGTL